MLNLHYVAGIIDGEGCIGFDYRKSSGLLSIRISVQMVTKIVPELLFKQFGGSVFQCGIRPDRNQQAITKWQIYSDEACNFLYQIKDILLIKNLQAHLAIAFHEQRTEMDLETHKLYKDMMHKLNKVGLK